MPTYDWSCWNCGEKFSKLESIHSYDGRADCPACERTCTSKDRNFSRARTQFIGTKVQDAEYNPGLGRVIKNKRDLDWACKEKNVVEVGNDYKSGESMQTGFERDKQRAREKSWESV